MRTFISSSGKGPRSQSTAATRGVKLLTFLGILLVPTFGALPAEAKLDLGVIQLDLGDPVAPRMSAICTFMFPVYVSPGFSLTRQAVVFESRGETGSASCTGKLGGHTVTGPGSVGVEGTHFGDCVSDTGSGRYFITVPTDSGPKHFEGTFNETRIGLNGLVEGSEPGARFRGTYVVVPTRGDCALNPITETLVIATTVHSDT